MGTQPRCVQTPVWTSHSPVFSPAKSVSERFSSVASAAPRFALRASWSTDRKPANGARLGDLLLGAVADEDGLAEEEHGQLRAHGDAEMSTRIWLAA
jgi:hypothetical protein